MKRLARNWFVALLIVALLRAMIGLAELSARLDRIERFLFPPIRQIPDALVPGVKSKPHPDPLRKIV